MKKIFAAIIVTSIIQLSAIGVSTGMLVSNLVDQSRNFALQAEREAVAQSHEFTLQTYQNVVSKHDADLAALRADVDRMITLRLTRAKLPLGLPEKPTN